MIDWMGLFWHGLWVTGLSVLLAVASYTSWMAVTRGQRWRQALAEAGPRLAMSLGALLFIAGAARSSRHGWEWALWLLLGVVMGLEARNAWREWRSASGAGTQMASNADHRKPER